MKKKNQHAVEKKISELITSLLAKTKTRLMKENKMNFDTFWQAYPKSPRKGAKSLCKAKWDKLKLDAQAEQIVAHVTWMATTNDWKKDNGAYIPAPLVYLNQMRWDGAEIPEQTINVNVYVDPALQKIHEDAKKAVPMPKEVREMLNKIKQGFLV